MVATISALPTPPTRADAANFAARADAFLPALVTFGAEANALADEVNDNADAAAASALTAANAPGTSATSTTSVAVGAGSKSLTIQTGKALVAGQWVILDAAPNWMVGRVTSYITGTGALVVDVQYANGSGSPTAWVVSLAPPILFKEATAAQIRAGTLSLVTMTPAAQAAALANVPIAFASSLTFNGADAIRASTTVTANLTLPNPTGLVPGYVYRWLFLISGAGGFSLGFGSNWEFVDDTIPTFSQTAGRTDALRFELLETGKVLATLTKGYLL